MQAFAPSVTAPPKPSEIAAAVCERMHDRNRILHQSNVKARLEWEAQLAALRMQGSTQTSGMNEQQVGNMGAMNVLSSRTERIVTEEEQVMRINLYEERMARHLQPVQKVNGVDEQNSSAVKALQTFRETVAQDAMKKQQQSSVLNTEQVVGVQRPSLIDALVRLWKKWTGTEGTTTPPPKDNIGAQVAFGSAATTVLMSMTTKGQ